MDAFKGLKDNNFFHNWYFLAEIKLHIPHNCMWRDVRIYEQVDECFCACQYKKKIQSPSRKKI